MTFNYTKSATTATKLLTNFGQTVTLRKQVSGAYDPDTGTAAIVTTDYTGIAALLDFESRESGQVFEDGVAVQSGDKRAYLSISGITVAPVPNDLLVVSSVNWSIVNVKTLSPAGTTVMYELHLRK